MKAFQQNYQCAACGDGLRPDWRAELLHHVTDDTEEPCQFAGHQFKLPVVELEEVKE